MTLQEIFDIIANHLLTQNQKSLSSQGMCVYKSTTELSCAVGCLLKNKDTTSYEGIGVHNLRHNLQDRDHKNLYQDLLSVGVPDIDEAFDLLDDLQTVHDLREPKEWKKQLQELAENKGLLCKL